MTKKLITVWILGTICLFIGSWIVGHLEYRIGVSQNSYILTLLLSFLLFLFGGLCWISVAVAAGD